MAVKVSSLFAKAPGFSYNQSLRLRKPKPGATPHQGGSSSAQSQKEELQIQKRILPLNRENQILSGKLVQINFRQDCFTNNKRPSNPFSILSKTTENNPSSSPSFEGRIRNIKSRNSIFERQRRHHGNSFNSSKVYKLTLYSPKTLRGETTCYKPCSPEQSHLQSTIQDGRFRKSQIPTKPWGLFLEERPLGCLSIYSSPQRLTTLPGIYFRPGHVCFQNDAIQAKRGTSSIYQSLQTSFGRSEGTVYLSSHMARRYPSNLNFLFKLHSRSRHCYGPTSEPRFSVKHGKLSPHSNSESHLPRYGDRFVNHDFFSSRREGFSNCSKGNNSKAQESGISKGNLPVHRNVLGYSPCSKGSSNSLSAASTPSDNLTERKFTFKKPMLLSKIHASPPCPARSGLVDTPSFHFNFKSNHSSTSRHLYSDRRFRPGVGRLPETTKDFGNVDQEPTFLTHKQKGIDGNFSQSKVFPKIPGECPCSNNDRQLNKCVLSKPYGRDKISHCFKSGTRHLEMVPTKSCPHFSSTCCRPSERFCRSTLPLSTVEHRVDAMQENIQTDCGSLWMSSDRSLRLISKPPAKNILFLDSRPKSLKNRYIHFQLGFQPSLPVSSISSNSQMPFKDKERQMQGNTNSPSVEIKTLVSNYFRDANGSPSSPPNPKGSLATSPIKSNSSSADRQKKELQTSRLACVRESLRLNKVPERVSKIIFASWRPGTEKHYQSAWCKFNSWCEERSINSISCPITEILSFLSDLYYNGMQYRTINLY